MTLHSCFFFSGTLLNWQSNIIEPIQMRSCPLILFLWDATSVNSSSNKCCYSENVHSTPTYNGSSFRKGIRQEPWLTLSLQFPHHSRQSDPFHIYILVSPLHIPWLRLKKQKSNPDQLDWTPSNPHRSNAFSKVPRRLLKVMRSGLELRKRVRRNTGFHHGKYMLQFTNVQPSLLLMNWSKKMYCGFELCTPLLSMSEIPVPVIGEFDSSLGTQTPGVPSWNAWPLEHFP